MPYIGKSPVGGGFHKLDNLTASATATYALTLGSAAYYPETANQLLVSLNGVIQAPQDSFTVSGSNLIFDSALTASDSIDFVVALGDVLGVGSVSDGAITTAKIGNNAVTDAKIAAMAASKLTGSVPSAAMPAGSVLQVVTSTDAASANTTSASYVVAGSLSASITPSSTSSKIFVQVNSSAYLAATGAEAAYTIYRDNTTNIGNADGLSRAYAGSSDLICPLYMSVLDSPATTSSVTYNIYLKRTQGSGSVYVNLRGGLQTMTLMEIAG
jgi:hypothetical protein